MAHECQDADTYIYVLTVYVINFVYYGSGAGSRQKGYLPDPDLGLKGTGSGSRLKRIQYQENLKNLI